MMVTFSSVARPLSVSVSARDRRDRARRAWQRARSAAVLVVVAAIATATLAKDAPPQAADPVLEARMVRIASELRCLVCQNQTIADSNASLAVDLRRETRDLLKQGKSDAEVIDYMTARYGDFVLYRPPMRATTVLLWFGPALLLGIGGGVLVMVLRRRSRMAPDAFDPDDDDATRPAPAAGAADAAGAAHAPRA
ncbi:MAG: cytochrome c-type biogenesis protein [Caldimonas sp.]